MSQKPRPVRGRYDLTDAREPGTGRGRPPPSLNARTAIKPDEDLLAVAVPEPPQWASYPGERIVATVNRRVDILEDERSHGRISEAAYQAGRLAQAAFERASRGPGHSNWQGGSRVDAWIAHEAAILDGVVNARAVLSYLDWMRRNLGMIDARLVARILRERMSYAECASLQGKGGARGTGYIASRFRDALEALAEAKAARGRDRAT